MRELLIVVAIILLASLVLNGYFIWDRAQALKLRYSENEQFQEAIADHEATIKKAGDRINEVEAGRVRDSLAYKSRESALKIDLARHKAKASQLRPKLQAKIDSFPDLREFVELQDSIITKQDSLIRSQELFCQLQVTDLKEIISMTQQKYEAQVQISKLWEESAVEYEQESNKLRKQAKFKNLVIYGLGGVVLWMAITD